MSRKSKDITGLVFNRLTVVRLDFKNQDNTEMWLCKCECGNFTSIRKDLILRGATKSCGCLAKEMASKTHIKHGLFVGDNKNYTPEYVTWVDIKRRCNKKHSSKNPRYSGRGISMSNEWMNSFDTFIKDMGYRPSDNYSIERIDNNGDYCKENCKWGTISEQSRNKSSTIQIEYNGETRVLADWLAIFDRKTAFSLYYTKIKEGLTPKDVIEFFDKNKIIKKPRNKV